MAERKGVYYSEMPSVLQLLVPFLFSSHLTAQSSSHAKRAAPTSSTVSAVVKTRLAAATVTAAVVEIDALEVAIAAAVAAAAVVALCSAHHPGASMVQRQPRDSAAQI